MPDLQNAVEDWVAALPADEFRALVARTRPPDEPLPAAASIASRKAET